MKRSHKSRTLHQLTLKEPAASSNRAAQKGSPVTSWAELIEAGRDSGSGLVIAPVVRKKQDVEVESVTLKRHKRLLEESRLISQFDRHFGYPPPPFLSGQSDLTSVLQEALETGAAPEGWKPTHGRFSESSAIFAEPDDDEGS